MPYLRQRVPARGKSCRDCAAARKRAFAATVTQPLLAAAGAPSVGRPRFAPRPERAGASASKSRRRHCGAVRGGHGGVGCGRRARHRARPSACSGCCSPWRSRARSSTWSSSFSFAHHEPPRVTATRRRQRKPDYGGSRPGGGRGTGPGAARLPPTAAAGRSYRHRSPCRPRAKAAAASCSRAPPPKPHAARRHKAEAPRAAPVAPPPPAPEPVPRAARVAAPPVVEAPRDPWQAMNEGLSRCAREDWISRGACEQRLRLQYCPDHWGVVWQCPIGPTDHG